MADEAQTEEEPSIEEILDSIRQIISEDGEDDDAAVEDVAASMEEVAEPEEAAPEPEPEPEAAEEPLDQSAIDDMVFDEPLAAAPEPEATPEPVPEPEPEAAEEPEPEEEDIIDLTEKVKEEPKVEPDLSDDDNLLSQTAETAAVSAIGELVKKTAVEYNGVTLEEIVRTELRPMLKGWLDKNLPTIIERLVQEELERVSKRVLDE